MTKLNKQKTEKAKKKKFYRIATYVYFTNILRAAYFLLKCYGLLFFTYNFDLLFFVKRISAQKLLVKCWWNWLLAAPFVLPLKQSPHTHALQFIVE